MSTPQPAALSPLVNHDDVEHWACLEIDHSDHPLISLCGEPTELDYGDPGARPEHLCPVCQLLAPHHGVNCAGCQVYVRRWGLVGPL